MHKPSAFIHLQLPKNSNLFAKFPFIVQSTVIINFLGICVFNILVLFQTRTTGVAGVV